LNDAKLGDWTSKASSPYDALPSTLQDGCDCHVHIYELTRFPLASTSTYGPPQASWEDYVAVQHRLGLRRAILVQPTGYGFDNGCLLDALASASRIGADIARGIAVIAPTTSRAELRDLHDAGIRGVRFMMIPGSGGLLRWEDLLPMADKIAEFGWLINLQLDGREMAAHASALSTLPCRLSIDHIGKFLEPVSTDHPGFQALLTLLAAGNTWVKLSAPYETSKNGPPYYEDVSVLAKALASAHPTRCLWSSNWPHPGRRPVPDDGAMLQLLSHWLVDDADGSAQKTILVDNPAALYGFGGA
jgi:D-galactarolactone isomerase